MQARTKLKAGILAVGNPSKRDEAVLNAGGNRMESILYDFSTDTGAVGTLSTGRMLPINAVVTQVVAVELTNVTTSAAGTIKVTAGATDLIAATAAASVATGTIALASAATAIPLSTTAESELKIVIATGALTAGKVRFMVSYLVPNDL